MSIRILGGDVRDVLVGLPDNSVQCVVSSPPYWGLRSYLPDGHPLKAREIGLESTIEEHVAVIVEVFRAVRRVLRADGVLWLNLGDTYIGSAEVRVQRSAALRTHSKRGKGLKPKDMVGMPWRIALALHADGWWLRGDIIWHKPNPQPEAVLDRPTRSHEYVFQFSKSERYYYDAEAIKEPVTGGDHPRGNGVNPKALDRMAGGTKDDARAVAGLRPASRLGRGPGWRSRQNASFSAAVAGLVEMRNARSVWTIPTHPYPEAHFATFPPELAERCILAGTSARGACSKCGKPRLRVIRSETASDGRAQLGERKRSPARVDKKNQSSDPPAGIRVASATVGWRNACKCRAPTRPCVVLDPFGGAGTAGLVADRLGRDAILIELNNDYVEMAERRLRGDAPLLAEVWRT